MICREKSLEVIQSSGLGFIKRTGFLANRTVALSEFPKSGWKDQGERYVCSVSVLLWST